MTISLKNGYSKQIFKFSTKHVLFCRPCGDKEILNSSQIPFCIAAEVILQIFMAFSVTQRR